MSSSGLANIDPVGAFNRNDASALQNAATRQQNDTTKSLLPDYMAAQRAEYQKQSALAPLDVQNATLDADAKKTQYGNDAIAQAAMAAQAADPADAPQVWDDGMKDAAAKGVKAASQYIGHYRPQLAENVADIYGGKNARQGATAAALNPMNDPAEINRAISQMTPEQRVKGLKMQNTIIEGFSRVKDQTSFDNEVDELRKAGVPVDNFLLPNADWRMNYAHVAGIIKEMVPRRDALQAYVAQQSTGGPVPTVPVDKDRFVNVTPGGTVFDKATGQGVYTAPNRPSAGQTTFDRKYQMAMELWNDPQKALEYANGKRSMDDTQMRMVANGQAQKALESETFAGATIDNPDAWLKAKADELYKSMKSTAVQPVGTPGVARSAPPPPSALPQRALNAVKAAKGQPVRFNNGMSYKWVNGKVVHVP